MSDCSDYEVKQVIVMRKDLNMRKGKMIAQGAHASLGVILNMMDREESVRFDGYTPITRMTLNADGYIRDWLIGRFAKIALSVDSEAELLEIYEKARSEGLPTVLITDAGFTEFKGVPTNTCIGIGPWHRDIIDKITGHLKLL